jgi:hypothetical protein
MIDKYSFQSIDLKWNIHQGVVNELVYKYSPSFNQIINSERLLLFYDDYNNFFKCYSINSPTQLYFEMFAIKFFDRDIDEFRKFRNLEVKYE